MQTRALGTFQVSAIGLGCMNLDHAYGPATSELDGERVLLGALDAGYTHLDTATLYGGGKNEERIGRVLARHRQRFVLASKCGTMTALSSLRNCSLAVGTTCGRAKTPRPRDSMAFGRHRTK